MKDAHWYLVSDGNGGQNMEVLIHYQFGGTVSSDDQKLFRFVGGHSCRRIITVNYGTKDVTPYINKNYPPGKTEDVYYKPPDASRCYVLEDLNTNFEVGVTLLSIAGACLVLPMAFVAAVSASPSRNPVEIILLAVAFIILFPILLPAAIIYSLLQSSGCIPKPRPEHPIHQYSESVKKTYAMASQKLSGKLSSAAASVSSKVLFHSRNPEPPAHPNPSDRTTLSHIYHSTPLKQSNDVT